MKVYGKYLLIALAGGIFNCLILVLNSKESYPSSYVVLSFGLSALELYSGSIGSFFSWYFPFLLFQVLWGTYLYRHFCSASVYYFSRCGNRVRWFLKEAGKLYSFTVLYLSILLGSGLLVMQVTGKLYWDAVTLPLLLYYFELESAWLFRLTLLVNVLAIKLSSSGGFILVGGFQLLCVGAFAMWHGGGKDMDATVEQAAFMEQAQRMRFNPISHIILGWHSSKNSVLDSYVHQLGITFDFSWSVLLLLLLAVISLLVGCFIVKRQEFIIINRETGGSI